MSKARLALPYRRLNGEVFGMPNDHDVLKRMRLLMNALMGDDVPSEPKRLSRGRAALIWAVALGLLAATTGTLYWRWK